MANLVTDKFKRYLYDLENALDEFVIVFLSMGAILVSVWAIFVENARIQDLVDFGLVVVRPWLGTLALMIIARELWLLNRKISHYLEQEKGE